MSKVLLTFGVIISLLFSYHIVYEIDNTNYVNLVNETSQGLQAGTKAALIQLENNQNNTLKNIGQGFLEQVPNDFTANNFNNYIKLDIDKAIETFFATYYAFFKNNMYDRSNYLLEKATTIAVIEPVRFINGEITDTIYRLYIYKFSISENRMVIENINDYQYTSDVETAINNTLSKMIIKLNNTGASTSIVDLEKKTYFIAVTEDLQLPLYNQPKQKFITAFYFEGSNLERNKTFRGKEK